MSRTRRTGAPAPPASALCAATLTLLAQSFACAAPPAPPAPASASAEAVTLDQLMRLLSQRRHGEADFSEVRYLSVLSEPLRSSGVLLYEAPDHLEERILQPRAETVVLDHGILTLRRGQRERSVPLAGQPQIAPLVDSIRALLAGERGALEEHFTLQLSGSLEHWRLQLEPREPTLRSNVREIDMAGARDAILEVQLHAANGDRSVMQIQPRP